MKFGRVSGTPYCNCSLLYILLLDVFCSTVSNVVEYKLLFRVAILYYVFHGIIIKKLCIVEYNYGYRKKYC